ncbi:MAG: RagB/SusD family nutrient uptake outer membrane protein [Bacteroides sp.]|nr:RagB/SusD family nutrient uptake outer membrane protein [Bacteroides sp.]
MIDAFPLADGKRAVDLAGNPVNGYDPEKFYRNRDPRFYRTFAFSGCRWVNTPIWLYAYKVGSQYRYTDGTTGDAGAMKKSKAIVWKMSDENTPIGSETYSGTDIMEYRYAEILLNIAEAYAATGDLNNCMTYLKKIRERVGIPAADNYGLGAAFSSKYAAIEACLHERQIELAYEGKRSWDLRRWLLFDGGAGFDPGIAGADGDGNYDPTLAWGQGWKIYDGKEGRPNYTTTDNVVTKLGYPFPLNGYKHTGEIWGYQLDTDQGSESDPLAGHSARGTISITRNMSEADRNAEFDKLDAFYASVGFVTEDPMEGSMGPQYAMDSGSSAPDRSYLFSFRGWYYIYPLHYDFYDPEKGNDWLKQNAGWMYANANGNATDTSIQDGDYYYCQPE